MAVIEFNYNQAVNQSKQIESIAYEMLDLANKQYQTTIDSIEMCWRGEAAKQFIVHCASTQSDIIDEANRLLDLSGRIRNVASIIKKAEDEAKAIQQRRSTQTSTANTSSGAAVSSGTGSTASQLFESLSNAQQENAAVNAASKVLGAALKNILNK